MSNRAPGEGRYAHVEREQRWVLPGRPAGCDDPHEIVDRYVIDTTLRLRRSEDGGGVVVFKLGQKVRARPGEPETVRLTNMYLTGDEYALLSGLPADELRKTRWHCPNGGHRWVVDVFGGLLRGLVLAELELAPGEARVAAPSGWSALEVTDDDRFSGGALAGMEESGVDRLLAVQPTRTN